MKDMSIYIIWYRDPDSESYSKEYIDAYLSQAIADIDCEKLRKSDPTGRYWVAMETVIGY